MDQGLAALMGAAIGVVGTTGASALAGWAGRRQVQAQQAGEHARWRRQGQRETYASFLTAVERVREHSHQSEARELEETSRLSDELNERVEAVMRTLSMVIVEGPDEVVAVAEELRDTSCEVASGLMTILEARRSGADLSGPRRDLAEQQNWLDELITAYAKAVRSVLDQGPGS
ncbi:hypothetical protein [Streptomyces sp. NPDC056948]|uniref:hypothetical protein n=1 Tax=Streptomyces sp. NPDC056948 TaxID=3345975 RepID=UPI003632701C